MAWNYPPSSSLSGILASSLFFSGYTHAPQQIITNARSTALLRANATFLPSFELFQGKWFSWCGEMISRVCFLGCWQNLDEDKESIFSLIYSFRDVRDFFFFIYRWHVELNCVFQGKWWNSRRINYCRSKNRLWLLELFLM